MVRLPLEFELKWGFLEAFKTKIAKRDYQLRHARLSVRPLKTTRLQHDGFS